MDKYYKKMQEGCEKMTHQFANVQKNCGMSIKKGVNLTRLRLLREMQD